MDSGIKPAGADPTGSVSAGFTLIELLVGVAVLAVLAVGASLVATRGGSADSDATRFVRSYEAARHLAVMGREMRGLHITPRGFQPLRAGADGWTGLGREIRWRDRASLAPQGASLPGGWPEIVVLPDGRGNAFSIRFGSGGGSVACQSDGWTGVSCDGG